MITIKRLREKDIPYLIKLSESVGWDYNSEEIKTIFQSGIVYGEQLLKRNGKLYGIAAQIFG